MAAEEASSAEAVTSSPSEAEWSLEAASPLPVEETPMEEEAAARRPGEVKATEAGWWDAA